MLGLPSLSTLLRRLFLKHGRRNGEVCDQRKSETETAQQLSPTDPSTPDRCPLESPETNPHPTSSSPSPIISNERMQSPSSIPPTNAAVELQSYSENQDYLAQGTPEPSARSQTLIYRLGDYKWWIKTTFVGTVLNASEQERQSKRERRGEYQAFVKLIQYNLLPLLDNTVTEVILEVDSETVDSIQLKHEPTTTINRYAKLARNLGYSIQEDPLRVIYPLCDEFPSFRQVHSRDLTDSEEITDGVFRVSHRHDNMRYIYKVIERPLYHPHDTSVIRSELENLTYFQGVPHIAQAAGIVVCRNPYTTSARYAQPPVLSGILLQYYPGGSLQDTLSKPHLQIAEYPWDRWGIQIATALSCFHTAGRTHMDIKPSNIVLDAEGNAVLIDISGIGGVTRAWRAPEIRDELSPIELPFETRRWNDVWAYGKLLSEIAALVEDSLYSATLKSVSARLMEENIRARIALSEAISLLEAGRRNIK